MIKRLTRTGNSLAIVLDKPLLEQMGVDENTDLEISTDGHAIVITPVGDETRARKFKKAVERVNEQYEGLFRRLSK